MKNNINKIRESYNLEIEAPFEFIYDGFVVKFDCLIKGYGAKNGMVIDSNWVKLEPCTKALETCNFGFSCFDISDSDISSFKDLLVDWGIYAV